MNIYLAQQYGTNFYKIGVTKKNPELRLKELQTGSPILLILKITYYTKYDFLLENALHNHFKLKRINSEWFELTEEDVKDFIEVCKKLETSFEILKDNIFFPKKF